MAADCCSRWPASARASSCWRCLSLAGLGRATGRHAAWSGSDPRARRAARGDTIVAPRMNTSPHDSLHPGLQQIGVQLEERYGELGRGAYHELRRWLGGAVPLAYPEILERHLGEASLSLIFDAFWQ